MKNKNKNITTKFRKSKSGGKSGVVSALDYTRLLPSVQYVKKKVKPHDLFLRSILTLRKAAEYDTG